MNHTSEALTNIKTLKLYSWTSIFSSEIYDRREHELEIIKVKALTIAFVIVSLYFFPNILSSVVFSTYIGTGHYINLSDAFAVLIFFELIKTPTR